MWVISFLAFVYGFASFYQMLAEHRLQYGNLRGRLTLLILVITTPLLLAVLLSITTQINTLFEQSAEKILKLSNNTVSISTSAWLESRVSALKQLALLPEVYSKDAESQLPVLKALTAAHEDVVLASTVDLEGKEVARSDGQPLANYSDADWFRSILHGDPVAYQAVADPETGQTNLLVGVPIKDHDGQVDAVLLSVSEIAGLTWAIRGNATSDPVQIGKTGYAFVVDDQNRVILHPDSNDVKSLSDLDTYFPVIALRRGEEGLLKFTDDQGVDWWAFVSQLNNGWGIISLQTATEVLAPFQASKKGAAVIGMVGVLLLSGVIWLTVQYSLFPVKNLTETAMAVSEGDLSSQASVESDDELGFLAETMNRMTWQLKESIASLEDRVLERTAALERRSNQLRAAALVSKEASGIRDIHQMMNQTVQLISSHFGFYHAGIFIIDDVREYAVLQAANSDGGQRMLARGHKLRVGQVGIVGFVADVGVPRVALDVGEDAVFFNNPDLPMTRSEMALPLKARGQVMGVLDVQSVEQSAFTDDDVETLQVLADQVALALDNARLLKDSRDALEELRNLYGQRTRQAWKERLERGVISYRYSRTGWVSSSNLSASENLTGVESLVDITEPAIRINQDQHEMLVPITLRGQVLGSLILRREKEQNPWSRNELQMATELIAQVIPALENARLLEENQSRAQMETLVGQVSSRIQSSLDLDTVLKTAVQEIGLVINASRVQIRLEKGEDRILHPDGSDHGGNPAEDLI
jgi:GAF domain-containing protein/HAMP domain-containing protein